MQHLPCLTHLAVFTAVHLQQQPLNRGAAVAQEKTPLTEHWTDLFEGRVCVFFNYVSGLYACVCAHAV